MKNSKFIEYITKQEKFYNSLSDKNKNLISDLDTYFSSFDFYISSDNTYDTIFLLIGIKNKQYCLCKSELKTDVLEGIKIDIFNGEIIFKNNLNDLVIANNVKRFFTTYEEY